MNNKFLRIVAMGWILLSFLFLGVLLYTNINNKKNTSVETESSVSIDDTDREKKQYSTIKMNGDESLSNSQIYESFLDFPYENMSFAEDEVGTVLKNAYINIDFYGEFKKGNLEEYDFYISQYKKLLNCDITFTVPNTEEEFFLNEYDNFKIDYDNCRFDLNNYFYYFFDFNEDETPELGIVDGIYNTYIFKYEFASNKFILWKDMSPAYYQLNGSLKIRWNREGIRHAFYKLDGNGKEVYSVFFLSKEGFNKSTNQAEKVYMVALPRYINKDEQIEITEIIEKQAYFDDGQKLYYFRVAEGLYNELTKDYFLAEELAIENIKKVSFAYDELFGDIP